VASWFDYVKARPSRKLQMVEFGWEDSSATIFANRPMVVKNSLLDLGLTD
jgi:hypothetical protein